MAGEERRIKLPPDSNINWVQIAQDYGLTKRVEFRDLDFLAEQRVDENESLHLLQRRNAFYFYSMLLSLIGYDTVSQILTQVPSEFDIALLHKAHLSQIPPDTKQTPRSYNLLHVQGAAKHAMTHDQEIASILDDTRYARDLSIHRWFPDTIRKAGVLEEMEYPAFKTESNRPEDRT